MTISSTNNVAGGSPNGNSETQFVLMTREHNFCCSNGRVHCHTRITEILTNCRESRLGDFHTPGSWPEDLVIELYDLLTYFVVCNDELHARDILPLATLPTMLVRGRFLPILNHARLYLACPVCGIPDDDESSLSDSDSESDPLLQWSGEESHVE